MRIGIDVGGTNVAAGVVTDEGVLVDKMSRPTRVADGYAAILNDIAGMCIELSKGHEISKIGIGVPGVCTPDSREVYACKNLFWDHKPIAKDLESKLMDSGGNFKSPITVSVDNDANVAAWAEYVAGAMKGSSIGVMVTLGTGVGGGIVIDGRPLRGAHGLGSEIGHMYLGENFYTCNCGKMGCFETFSSATALIRHYTWLYENCMGSVPEEVTAKKVIDLARLGDELALDSFERFTRYLAQGLMNIIMILDPEVISIGGGVSHAGDFLYDRLKKEMEDLAFIKGFPMAKVVPAILGNDAGIIGAAMIE